jgi:hypothetical protein
MTGRSNACQAQPALCGAAVADVQIAGQDRTSRMRLWNSMACKKYETPARGCILGPPCQRLQTRSVALIPA